MHPRKAVAALIATLAIIGMVILAGPASAAAPVVTIEPAEAEYTTAAVKGEVNPEGKETNCHFEYVTDAQFQSNEWAGASQAACAQNPLNGSALQPVSAELTGLSPSTTYHLRLVAENEDGSDAAVAANFETKEVAKPTIENLEVTAVNANSAHFSAAVDPNGTDPAFDAHWRFHCTPSCGELSGAAVSGSPETVEADAELEPSTHYTVTLTAENLGGKVEESTSFTTAGAKPLVRGFAAGPVQPEAADLNGEVDSRNVPTEYWFEWGTSSCSANPNPCAETPRLPAGSDEVQQLMIHATAGSFNLSFEGETTPDLFFASSPEEVQEALEGLPAIGAGNVSVSGGEVPNGTHFRVTFVGDLARTDVEQLTAASGTPPLTINEGASSGSIELFTYVNGGYDGFYKLFVEHLTGLTPGTTYHFRILAENASGLTEGPDEQFTTAGLEPACTNQGMPGTGSLPDCRAYEMVSPPEKRGIDILTVSNKTHVSPDGNRVAFDANAVFDEGKGSGPDDGYLSDRTGTPGTNGWSAHSINPLGGTREFGAIFGGMPTFAADYSPDLTTAIFRSWRPLTDEPHVAEVNNFYRLSGLDGSSPDISLLTPSVAPLDTGFPPEYDQYFKRTLHPALAGASSDLSHVIFWSQWNYTTDGHLSFAGNLYEYADGSGVRLVARVPQGSARFCEENSGTPCENASSAEAGVGNNDGISASGYSEESISRDGARVVFQVPSFASSGAIYMREDGTRTYQLNASEKEPSAEPGPASFWAMSADGSRAFFTTGDTLVEGGGPGLYMYEVDKPVGERLTYIAPGDAVVGASKDGHYVYFESNQQLVAGKPQFFGGGLLFLWHDGNISYIGHFGEGGEERGENTTRANFFADPKLSRVSPDGRYLLFGTRGDSGFVGQGGFSGHDQGSGCRGGGCQELYLYSADSGRLVCASCGAGNGPDHADAVPDALTTASPAIITQHLSNALSDDGRFVFFSTQEALLPEDTNGRFDAYEYDLRTNEVHLLSTGTASTNSYYLDSNPTGSDVMIATRQRLVGWDQDGNYDVYDVRIDGGFPEPTPVPAACAGEACLPSTPAPPPAAGTASAATGPGNPPKVCPKGTRRVNRHGSIRCVKKHHRKRHAKHNRRAGR